MPLDGVQNTQLSRYLVNRAARAAGTLAARGRLRRQPRLQHHTDEELNAIPAQYLSTSRVRDQATIDFLARRCPIRSPAGCCRPASPAPTWRARSCCGRSRSSTTCRPTASTAPASTDSAQVKLETAVQQGLRDHGHLHLVALHREGVPTERHRRRLREAAVARRRAAPRDDQHPLRAAVRPGTASSARNASGLLNRLIGGWSVNAIGQFQSGRPLDFGGRNIYFNGDLDALKANYSDNSDVPVFDISGFYFHDAAVQTNGVDDPVKQRADTAHPPRQQRPLLPVARRRHPQPVPEAVGHLDRQAGADRRPRSRAVQRRVPQRVQRRRLQRREHRSRPTRISARSRARTTCRATSSSRRRLCSRTSEQKSC